MSLTALMAKGSKIMPADSIGQILIAKNIITETELDQALKRQDREKDKYLGQILCEMGISQSKIIKALYYSQKRKQMGRILVDLNVITEDQLQRALAEQKRLLASKRRKPLGLILVDNGIIDEDHYVSALSVHFSMPIISLKGYLVSEQMQKAVGEQYALQQRIVVLENGPHRIIAAIAEPNLYMMEELERVVALGRGVMFCIAKASEIELCLNMKYDPYFGTSYR
jgi:hypothetical protein